MKITVDTNILVRAVVRDDEKQAMAAAALFRICARNELVI
jgi:predicted nucleic acid-binding protein